MSQIAPDKADGNPAVHTTLYRGIRPRPIRQDDFDSWDDFAFEFRELLNQTPQCEPSLPPEDQKVRLFAFSPHRLSVPYRKAENVESLTMLVLDIDRCDLPTLATRIDELSIAAVVYGSPSDDASVDDRRVRVIAPVSRDIAPNECEQTRFAFAELLGLAPGAGVEGAKEASKIFFVGRLHDTPEREWIEASGEPVDVDTLLAAPLQHQWEKPTSEHVSSGAICTTAYERAVAIAATWPGSVSGQGDAGSNALRLANALVRVVGDDAAAVQQIMLEHFNAGCPPNDQWQPDQIRHKVDDAVAQYRQLASVARWDTRRLARNYERDPFESVSERDYNGPPGEFSCFDDDDFATAPEPLIYVVPDLELAAGKVSAIQASANTGKTPFALALTICLAAGVDFFGLQVAQCNAAYMAFEGRRYAKLRGHQICLGLGLDPASIPMRFPTPRGQLDDTFVKQIEEYVKKYSLGVLTVDTYSSATDQPDFNSSAFANRLQDLGAIADTLNVLILVLMHENRSGASGLSAILGSSIAHGAIQASVKLDRVAGDAYAFNVSSARNLGRPFKSFGIRFDDEDQDDSPEGKVIRLCRTDVVATTTRRTAHNAVQAQAATQAARQCGELIMRDMPPNFQQSPEQMAQMASVPSPRANALCRAVSALRQAGFIELRQGQYFKTDAGGKASLRAVGQALAEV